MSNTATQNESISVKVRRDQYDALPNSVDGLPFTVVDIMTAALAVWLELPSKKRMDALKQIKRTDLASSAN